jgi:hypothetical protein
VETEACHIYIYTENGTKRKQLFCLFAANKKLKQQTSVCLLQTKTENGSLSSLVDK